MPMSQRRPTGTYWPTDEAWKAQVNLRLAELAMSRADLARACGVTNASISNMLAAKSQQSRLVPLVHVALRWPPPASVSVADTAKLLIDTHWESLKEDQRQAISALIQAFIKKT